MKKTVLSVMTLIAGMLYVNSTIAQDQESNEVTISNLGNSINSKYQEYAPVISADGSLLIFTTRRPTTAKQKERDIMEQVWFSEFNETNKTWNTATPLPANINAPKRNISNIALSNDGQKMLLYMDDLTLGTGDIYESVLKGDKWSDPVKLPEPINSGDHESSATYSPEGKTIYFVSDRPGGKGGLDIWYSKQDKKGKWGKAVNLGPIVNSSEDEESVFIHPDGTTLFFSSKRSGGLGGYDIYKTEVKKNKWVKPINVGNPINTDGDDLFFVMEASGQTAFYSSDQKGTVGGKDIFQISYDQKEVASKTTPSLALLKGTVSDEKTGALIESDIELIDNSKNEVIARFKSNNISGKYLISLPSGKNYGINVLADGYLFQSENVDFPEASSYIEIIKNIKLKKIEIGSKVVLNNIFFDYGVATLKPESMSELEKLTKLLKENAGIKVEISGHTDNKGNAASNKLLSNNRAKTVVDYLISQGIQADRLMYKGYGFDEPIATNETEEGRKLNRRTEFSIIQK